MTRAATFGIFFLLLLGAGFGAFHWTINRVYVPAGKSLLLRYKGPLLFGEKKVATGRFASYEAGEIGIIEQLRGPGRHFYCPIWWERQMVNDVVVEPGNVAIIISKLGRELPQDQFLVDGKLGETEYKGILRVAYGPGRYRINSYAYEVKLVRSEVVDTSSQAKMWGWVEIPTGYVGVVTNLADNPLTGGTAGIQNDVFPPGIYLVNGREQQIDIVEVGFREKTVSVTRATDASGRLQLDASGEPVVKDDSTGIMFPSNDGFPIHMDFTAIWGIMPDQAAEAVRKFGNVNAVEEKVVVPQIESICRNVGSSKGAVELLIGESRQLFQEDTEKEFKQILSEKSITLLYGLVRHIYIPQEVRIPIQNANIADELRLTRDQEQLTAKTEASLRESERKVELEAARVAALTEKLVAQQLAEGRKQVEETRARTVQLVAAIDKETAGLEAEADILRGQASATARKMLEEAKAQKFGLAVSAFGSGDAYNQWVFASNLPEDIQLNLLYAGEGTFWTDLDGFTNKLLGRQIAREGK